MTETDPQHTPDFDIPKTPYPDLKLAVILFFIIILNMVLVAIPAGIILVSVPNMSHLLKSLFNLLSYIAQMMLSINYALRKSEKQQGYRLDINFNRVQGWLITLIILGAFSLIIPLTWMSGLFPMPTFVKKIFEQTFTKDIFSIVNICIAAPILEEILFRGIVLKGLLKNYQPHKAILISAVFFALVHLNPWQAIQALIGGIYIGWVYYRTQSVIPGIIIHFTINFTASMMLFLPKSEQDFKAFFGPHNYILAIFVSVIIFIGAISIINKNVKAIPGSLFKNVPHFPPSS